MASADGESEGDVRTRRRRNSLELLPPDFSELRVVLLGNNWSEKRSMGNFILKEEKFICEKAPSKCEKVSATFENRTLTIINTPDLLQTNLSEEKLNEHVENCVKLSDPGPHVFLLVLQPEDFTEEQKWRVCKFLTRLNDRSFDYSMLLISTPREKIDDDDDSSEPLLKEMIVKCQYRHLKLKNIDHAELLTRLGQIVKKNNGYVSCDVFKDAAQRLTEEEEKCSIFNPTTYNGDFRIVMFGKSENKKKSLCNFILNRKQSIFFHLNPTKHTEVAFGEWKGKKVKVVKSPEIFSLSVDALIEEMQSCVSLSLPGPNVLLLLVKPSDFTERNRKTLKFVLSLFHEDFFKYSMVITTHADEMSPSANKLLRECRGRYYNLFSEDQTTLMQGIKNIVDSNRETFLSFRDEISRSHHEKMEPSLNLVLFGRRGAGKTSAVKAILGQTDLHSASSSAECVRNQGEACGRQVSLVELPALYGKAQQEVMEESFRCLSLCDPEGVHAFILVLPVGPLTDEDKGELQTIQDTFSSRVNDFTMVLFTVESDLIAPDVNFVDENEDIQDLCQRCGGRYFVLNLKDRQQIPEVLETAETIRGEASKSFSKEIFYKVLIERISKREADLQNVKQKSEDHHQKTEQLRKDIEIVKKREEELKKKHRADISSLQAQHEQQIKQKVQLLKEKEEAVEKERQKRKTEHEEAEGKWRKQEEVQRKEWRQKHEASEKRVKAEREQREASEKKLDQCQRERKRERDAWDKEKDGIWERMHQELKQNLQEMKKNLEDERTSHRKLQEEFYQKRKRWTYLWFVLSVILLLVFLYQSQ